MAAIVKVCGLTRIADLRLCLRLGADFVGAIVEIPRSPRSLGREQAARLLACAAHRGVVVTEAQDLQTLEEIARRTQPRALQLHGEQDAELVSEATGALGSEVEVWVALGLPAESEDAEAAVESVAARAREVAEAGAARIVLDSKVKGVSGGTGAPMNWELAAEIIAASPAPVLLAGGITPGNARRALDVSGAAGVDVSSGVEARPGVKSPRKLRELLSRVHAREATT